MSWCIREVHGLIHGMGYLGFRIVEVTETGGQVLESLRSDSRLSGVQALPWMQRWRSWSKKVGRGLNDKSLYF